MQQKRYVFFLFFFYIFSLLVIVSLEKSPAFGSRDEEKFWNVWKTKLVCVLEAHLLLLLLLRSVFFILFFWTRYLISPWTNTAAARRLHVL